MTVINLDRATVATLTTPDLYWDTDLKGFGLNVRLDARGKIARSFIMQYRVGKQQRKIKLGDCAKLNVDQARKKAEKLFAQILLGADPQGEKRDAAPKVTLLTAINMYIAMKERECAEGSYPRMEVIDVLGYRALATELRNTIWGNHFRPLGHDERRNFGDLIASWGAAIERTITAQLGEQTDEAA
jgi:hypothetical protein